MHKKLVTIQEFTAGLEELAAEQFPINQVTYYFKTTFIEPEQLQRYIHFTPEKYTRNLIHRTDSYALLLLGWEPGHRAPVHGHEGQKCWMRVEQGILRFSNYEECENQISLRSMVAGPSGYVDGPALIHSVENRSLERALSLHLYAHPFEQCDIYRDQKEKERAALSYFSMYGKPV
jgi:predicted metal-dependent enzyme (double-stranded beta helix superfamily)